MSQRQSWDLPCSVEPQKWGHPQPPTRSALSHIVLLKQVTVSSSITNYTDWISHVVLSSLSLASFSVFRLSIYSFM